MLKKASIALILVLSLYATFQALELGLRQYEINECNEWQSQSEEFVGYYSTEWQVSQCNHYGITL